MKSLTYASAGIDRTQRRFTRKSVALDLERIASERYGLGKPISLPFGLVFPSQPESDVFFDFEIEGVGTKTLIAELAGDYRTVGIDAVAMVVNDIIRSGAKPILLSDAIHCSKSSKRLVTQILAGLHKAAKESGCVIASGETGDVPEILHSPISEHAQPFDLFVSGLGLVGTRDLILGNIEDGDQVVGMESSGIHSNGLTLARKVLLRKFGGKYDIRDTPEPLERPILDELLEPTRIYVRPLFEAMKSVRIKAAVHITGDGFAKFSRLLEHSKMISKKRLGLRFGEGFESLPPVFRLIFETSKELGSPVSIREMFRTFNMGYGFAVIVSRKDATEAIDSFNKYCPAKRIGRVTTDGKIAVEGLRYLLQRTLVL